MKIKVRWLIDGVMEVDATDPKQAEEHAAQLLNVLIDQVPELKTHYGAQAIQGQALDMSPDDEDEIH